MTAIPRKDFAFFTQSVFLLIVWGIVLGQAGSPTAMARGTARSEFPMKGGFFTVPDEDGRPESEPQAQPQFTLTKQADRAGYCPGSLITYTLRFTNPLQTPVQVTITETLPAGTTFVSATAGGTFAPTPAPGTITWQLSNVSQGVREVMFTVKVNCGLGRDVILTNRAQAVVTLRGQTTTIQSNVVELPPESRCSLCADKTVDKTDVCAGDFLTYNIIIQNGSTASGPLQVTDRIPTGTTFVAANLGGMFDPGPPQQVAWSLPHLTPLQTVILTFTVQVNCDVRSRTQITNTATITGSGPRPVTTSPVTSIVASRCPPASHPCDGPPWAEETLTVDTDPPIVGEANRICAQIMNEMATPITSCSVLFSALPFGFGGNFTPVGTLTNVRLNPGANTLCVPYTPTFSGHTCVQATIHCPGFPDQISQRNLDDDEIIQPGGNDSIQFLLCNPDRQQPQTIQTNILENCEGVSFMLSDPNPTLGPGACIVETLTASVAAGVQPGTMCVADVVGYIGRQLIGGVRKKLTVGTPACVIRKKADRRLVCPGDVVTYTIDVACREEVKTLVVKDFVPAGTTFVSASGPGMLHASGAVSWALPATSAASLTLTVRINATTPPGTTITNIAQLEAPLSQSSNPVSILVARECAGDIVVLKSVDKASVCPGDFLTYTITVKNNRSSPIAPLTVTDDIPPGTIFVAANLGGTFSPTPAPGQVKWTLPSLAPGAMVDLTFTVQVSCDAKPGTQIDNVAVVQLASAALRSNQVVSVVTRACPPVSHPCDGPPWAERSITVAEDPPIVGKPNQICTDVVNNTSGPISMCSILFGVFPFSFGAPFIPVGSLMNITLVPGTNTLCIPYAPNFSGHTCVQAIIQCPGFEPQISQRNLENKELIPPGEDDRLEFGVCNPDPTNPMVVQLNLMSTCPEGVTGSLSENPLALAPGECRTVMITVNVGPNVPTGTMCTFDVVGYTTAVATTAIVPRLIGGVQKKITVGERGCVIRKRADKEAACPGDTITYTIDVKCDKPADTLLITDKVPTHTSLVTMSPGGVFSPITGEVSWVFSPAASATVMMTVRVNPTAPIGGTISDMAQLQTPVAVSSNIVTVQIPRTCPPPRQICISFDQFLSGSPVPPGTLITTQYSPLGVVFTSDEKDTPGLVTNPTAPVSPPNAVQAGSHLGRTMTARFINPATGGPAVTNFVSITTDTDTHGSIEKLIGLDPGGNVVATADVDFSKPAQVVSISTPTPQIHQVKLVTSDWFDDFCFAPVQTQPGQPSNASATADTPLTRPLGQHAWSALVMWALRGMR